MTFLGGFIIIANLVFSESPRYGLSPPIWCSELVKTNAKNHSQTLFVAAPLTTRAVNTSFFCAVISMHGQPHGDLQGSPDWS